MADIHFEPRTHSKPSASLLRLGATASSGFWSGIKSSFYGIMAGALACGVMVGFGSYFTAANPMLVSGFLTETVGLGVSVASSITGAFSAFPAVALGLVSGVAGVFLSLFTPIPYVFSIGSEWIGVASGLYSGTKESKERVAGEQKAAQAEQASSEYTQSIHATAHQRAAVAKMRLDVAQSVMATHITNEPIPNPLLQAGSNHIQAASIAHMGLVESSQIHVARI